MIKERLALLRAEMKKEGIDIYLIPTSDFHNSEYVGDYFRCREFMSGFTGSAGTLVVTETEAGLWTDGRYFLQAAEQLEGTTVELYRMGLEGVPTIRQFIADRLSSGKRVGFDGRAFSVAEGRDMLNTAEKSGCTVECGLDLVDRVWTDRPALSANDVFILEEKYCGESALDKLAKVREKMVENGCEGHLLTSLDDIAWLLNLRGSDVECNPVFLSYLYISAEDACLYMSTGAAAKVADYLDGLGITVRPYNSIYDDIRTGTSGCKIMIDENKLNYSLYRILRDCGAEICNISNPTTMLKAVKNSTEIASLHEANIRDGVAMVRFLHWLDDNIGRTPMTEISAADRLGQFRSEGDNYEGLSFDTIAGYNAHGAIIHYEPTPETDVELHPEGFLLVDSGAQYLEGTTDITRTIALGPVSDEMKHHYTMVLKGMLDLARIKFVSGLSGANLDVLARAPFWAEGLDYNHGTGHGVGFFLNVHEGPQRFHWNPGRNGSAALVPGMVITDEPGIYLENRYGIRIENDLLCVPVEKNEYGSFLGFEMLTLAPIDLRPVNRDDMTASQIDFLNAYHKQVREKLTPYLDSSDADWLAKATREL